MAKLLRVLTILLLILSIGALTLGSMLFMKREILKGRTKKVEDALINVAAFLEDGEPEVKENAFPAKDIDRIQSAKEFEPELDDWWDSYKAQLEDADRPTVRVDRNQLMSYYKINPIDLKIEKNAMGQKITTGPGTTDGELQRIKDAAEAQFARLNDTRLQLQSTRRYLVESIDELNSTKGNLRTKLAVIDDKNDVIGGLEGDVSRLEGNVARLQEEKLDLEGEIEQNTITIAELEDRKTEDEKGIVDLRERIKILGEQIKRAPGASTVAQADHGNIIAMEKGKKGTVVAVNPDWEYCVVEINDDFIREIEGMQRNMQEQEIPGVLPMIELHIKRGATQTYVTKVRLAQLVKDEMLAICDIDPDWKQYPVAKGDVVFH